MANAAFTRDEAILALDVLYFSGEKRLSPESNSIQMLSRLLNVLPIIPLQRRGEIFRNNSGVCKQITSFQRSYLQGEKDDNVGMIFYRVANEFKDKKESLHMIAQAIRRNADFISMSMFGSESEGEDFPEGVVLTHLHRVIERRDSEKHTRQQACEVCKLDLAEIYCDSKMNFLQYHLLTPLWELDANYRYGQDDFITVCPNCHAMLHQHRPWADRKTAGEILR